MITIRTRDIESKKIKKYTFANFDVFYNTIKTMATKGNIKDLRRLKSLNFEADAIRSQFQSFWCEYSNKTANFRDLVLAMHKTECNQPNKAEFWTSRGWSLEEAKAKVSLLQKNNSSKVDYSSEDRTITQVGYWIKKGLSKDEAAMKVSEIQKRNGKRSTYIGYHSIIGDLIFATLSKVLLDVGYSNSKVEVSVFDKSTRYIIDFVNEDLHLAIELYGCHVHPDPSMSQADKDKWRQAFTGKSYEEVLDHETKKANAIAAKGLDLECVYMHSTNRIASIYKEVSEAIAKHIKDCSVKSIYEKEAALSASNFQKLYEQLIFEKKAKLRTLQQ